MSWGRWGRKKIVVTDTKSGEGDLEISRYVTGTSIQMAWWLPSPGMGRHLIFSYELLVSFNKCFTQMIHLNDNDTNLTHLLYLQHLTVAFNWSGWCSGCSLCLAQWVRVQFPLRAVCANGFPIHVRSRRFSPKSPVSSCLQLVRCIVCYVHVWTPLEINLTTLRVILGVCLNKVIIIR